MVLRIKRFKPYYNSLRFRSDDDTMARTGMYFIIILNLKATENQLYSTREYYGSEKFVEVTICTVGCISFHHRRALFGSSVI